MSGSAGADIQVEDVPYAQRDGEALLARIYRPASETDGAPAIVDVHPGAWSAGDRTWGRVYDEALARRGFVVIALDFRQGLASTILQPRPTWRPGCVGCALATGPLA